MAAVTFEKNVAAGTKGSFAKIFNDLVTKGGKLDAEAFYRAAKDNGWQAARIFTAGSTMTFDAAQAETRITAMVDSAGSVKKYRLG